MILDAEVLLIDTKTSKPLPFGTLGVHKVRAPKPICASVLFFFLSQTARVLSFSLFSDQCCHTSRFSSPPPFRKQRFKMPTCASLFLTVSTSTA